jgi:hypothetical protein
MSDQDIIKMLIPSTEQVKEEILNRIATRVCGAARSDPETGEDYFDDSAIMREIRTEAVKMAHESIREKVDAIVEATLREGIIETNPWGEPKPGSTRRTLREIIVKNAQEWIERPADHYSKRTPLETLVAEIVAKVWTAELEKQATAAAKAVRDGITERFANKINEAVAAIMRNPAGK